MWDVPNWYTILSFLSFPFPMPSLPVLNVHVNFLAFPAVCYVKNIRLFLYHSIVRSYASVGPFGGSRTPTKRNSTEKNFSSSLLRLITAAKKQQDPVSPPFAFLFSPDRTHSTFPLLPVIDMNGLVERKRKEGKK